MVKEVIPVENLGFFEIKEEGWGRWKHLPKYSKEPSEYIYIVRNRAGQPLYVGKTMFMARRMQGHVKKPWFAEAKEVHILRVGGETHIDAELNAYEYERRAIEYLNPKWNKRPGGVARTSRYTMNPYSKSENSTVVFDRRAWSVETVGEVR